MKLALQSLGKRKLTTLLFIVQFTITIYVLHTAVMGIKAGSYQENQINAYLNADIDKTVHMSVFNASYSELFLSNSLLLADYINRLPGVEGFGGYDVTNTSFEELQNDDGFLALRRELTTGSFKEQYPSAVEIIKLDPGVYQLAQPHVVRGRNFQDSDFNPDQPIIPILIGEDYASVIQLEQLITDSHTGVQYRVIGFIGQEGRWFSGGDYVRGKLISLSDKFMAPFSSAEDDQTLYKSGSLFYTLSNTAEREQIDQLIENKARELNLGITCQSIREELRLYKQENKEMIFTSLFICAFLGVMALFGLITVSISTVLARKREFGIRMVTGASKAYIRSLIIAENFMIITIAAVFASAAILNMNYSAAQQAILDGELLHPMLDTNLTVIFGSIIMMAVVTLLASILPIQKINALKPVEMIGGNDR
jgi:putative ABC transport system permease protein